MSLRQGPVESLHNGMIPVDIHTSTSGRDAMLGQQLVYFNLFGFFCSFRKTQLNLYFEHLHKKYGKLVKVRTGNRWDIFVFDPEYIRLLMAQEGKCPNRMTPPILNVFYDKKGIKKTFSSLQGEEWHAKRMHVQKFINARSVNSYLPSQNSVANDLVIQLDKNENELEIDDVLSRYVADVNAVVAFNSKMGFLDDEILRECPEKREYLVASRRTFSLFAESMFSVPFFKYYETRIYKDFESSLDSVIRFIRVEVSKAIKRSMSEMSKCEDNLLINMYRSGIYGWDELSLIMHSLMFAGVNSTSATLQWLLWSLSGDEEVQARLHEEISENMGQSLYIQPTTLAHMPYLKACVKECFRLVFPSLNGSMRILPQETIVDKYILPKGTYVHFGHNALCRSEEYFESPNEFKPERWLSGTKDQAIKLKMSYAVMPFGFGPRSCLGRRFAEQEIYLAVIKIVQNFQLYRDTNAKTPEVLYSTIPFPSCPFPVKFRKR
ncbi:hypothetical protein ScPMuIL_012833 [Solemya velum]